jgi:GAF domain-containing protein
VENVARGRAVRPHEPTLQQAVRAFSDVAAALSESPVTDHVLHLIADRMCELVGVDRCSIYLRDRKTGLFHGRVGRARGNIDARVKRLVAGTYADRFTHEIVETRRNVLLTNAQNDPRPIQSTMRKWRVHAMLGVPMVVDDEVVGIAFLDNEGAAAAFTPLQQEIGAAFADLAAVVLAKSATTASLRAELDEAERRTAQWRRARAVEERFDRLLQADAALGDTLREASEISGKPVALYDAAWRQRGLAQAGAPQPVPNLGDRGIHQHAAFREALAGLQRSRTCVVEPLPAAGLHQRLLVHAVGPPSDVRGALSPAAGSTRSTPTSLAAPRSTPRSAWPTSDGSRRRPRSAARR